MFSALVVDGGWTSHSGGKHFLYFMECPKNKRESIVSCALLYSRLKLESYSALIIQLLAPNFMKHFNDPVNVPVSIINVLLGSSTFSCSADQKQGIKVIEEEEINYRLLLEVILLV